MRLAYICSPLRGNIEENMERAHEYCAYAASCGVIPLAPHTMFTHYLDDHRPEQREQGLEMGLELLKRCDEIWVMGPHRSQGMQGEIELAVTEKIPLLYIPDELVEQDIKIRQSEAAFTYEDCIPGSEKQDYTNQILVLKPETYGAGAEITADDSLWLADYGNGCRYGARGQAVFATHLLSGKSIHWERHDFCGIVEPQRLLDWLEDKPVVNDRAAEILQEAGHVPFQTVSEEIQPTPEQADYDVGWPYLVAACRTPQGWESIDLVPTAENIAAYISTKGYEGDLMITTPLDMPFISTFGPFIDRCVDQDFLQKALLPALIPMQTCQVEPPEIRIFEGQQWPDDFEDDREDDLEL